MLHRSTEIATQSGPLSQLFQRLIVLCDEYHLEPTMLVSRLTTFILFATTLSACEKWQWPPYESRLRSHFMETRQILEEVEVEMRQDGLVELTYDHIHCPTYTRNPPIQPVLTDEQQAKYQRILESNDRFVIHRWDESFTFHFYTPPTSSRDFVFRYVHG